MIDAASTIAGLIVGGGLGTIAGGLFAGGKIERLNEKLADCKQWSIWDNQTIRRQGREIAELRAERLRRLAALKAANEARKQAKIDRENAARELTAQRHAEMRELVAGII